MPHGTPSDVLFPDVASSAVKLFFNQGVAMRINLDEIVEPDAARIAPANDYFAVIGRIRAPVIAEQDVPPGQTGDFDLATPMRHDKPRPACQSARMAPGVDKVPVSLLGGQSIDVVAPGRSTLKT
jgi:hypothetical protein